jgi:tetratricopeptide (TPR) repeat protein
MYWKGMGRMVSFSMAVFLFLSACSLGKRPQPTAFSGGTPQWVTPDDPQKGLGTCQTVCRTHPKGSETLHNCLRTIETIKAEGDRAFDKENFARARSIYELLLKNFPGFSGIAGLLSFERSFLVTRLKMSRTFLAEEQAQSALKAGQVQKAIDVYRELHQHYPQDITVRTGFVKTLESIKSNADLVFDRDEFVLAGTSYTLLLKNFPSFSKADPSLTYDREQLSAKTKRCQRVLFEKGLEHYRSGDLDHAVLVWKKILVFDPHNSEVKKAVEVATLQSENLRSSK